MKNILGTIDWIILPNHGDFNPFCSIEYKCDWIFRCDGHGDSGCPSERFACGAVSHQCTYFNPSCVDFGAHCGEGDEVFSCSMFGCDDDMTGYTCLTFNCTSKFNCTYDDFICIGDRFSF